MHLIHELLISGLIVLGAIFALVGSYGMLKFPNLMTRLHAPTKATTLGVGGALVASMVYFLTLEGHVSIHEVLISLFLFLTAPITAHFIAKAYMHKHLKPKQLPKTQSGWSTYSASPAEQSHKHSQSSTSHQ
ncbi:Na+/H+ antiporter subunit G [Aquaspirillum serpens]|uniref:Na+/H+ antiporter subunit G n=1 Tax=Aquaspirillum serpens TaxID=190 RepID=UPI0003B5ACED|nr:Na+/H+ antiporter subunit G [Aquaspirillum serpens]